MNNRDAMRRVAVASTMATFVFLRAVARLILASAGRPSRWSWRARK